MHENTAPRCTGVVFTKNRENYTVTAGDCSHVCELSPQLRKSLIRNPSETVLVGDVVTFTPQGGLIHEVLPRRNTLTRRAAGPTLAEQGIAANVDQLVPVFSAANPKPHWNLLDRYLAAAEAQGISALVCITKLDLQPPADLAEVVSIYRQVGYPVIQVSAQTGAGLDELRSALAGRFSVLIGKSGVGKTSLLNALQPGLGQRVGAVSQMTGKGRHTTTHLEMFPLEGGGWLLDTPGMREFGLWDVEPDELAGCFPEMRPYLSRCRFGSSCRHAEEPGCAVRRAVMDGAIHPRRYKSYMRLQEEL